MEKFIGDAVMAVFGAPVAHEDDAERAVRAGLRILEAIDELNEQDPALSLQVRIGVNTGEAVVALGARPEAGRRHRHRGRRQHRRAPAGRRPCERDRLLRADVPCDGARLRLRGAGVGRCEGEDGAAGAVPPAPCPSPLRLGCDPHPCRTARWPRAREVGADRHVRAFLPAALLPARNAGGRAGGGKEPAVRGALRVRRGSPRARPLAPGSLPSLRRRDRLLGARGDRQGRVRHPRVGLARRGGHQASAGASTGRSRLRMARGPPAAARRGRRRARLAGGVLHRLAPRDRVLGRGAADDSRLRGPPLGRRRVALLPRAPRGLVRRGAAAGSLHSAPGAVRATSDLRRQCEECAAHQPRSADRG